MEELIFENHFKISTTCMRVNFCHPLIKRDLRWFIRFFLLQCLVAVCTSVIMYDLIYFAIGINDFSQICTDMVVLVMFIYSTIQYSLLLIHQSSFVKIINNITKDFEFSKTLPRDERKIVHKFADEGRFVCKQWLVLCFLGVMAFNARTIVLFIYYWHIGQFQYVQFYDATYPQFIENKKDNFLVFLVMYFLMMFYACYGCCMYVSIVPMGPIFILHACGQLELMRKRVENIFALNDRHLINEELKKILRHQNYILEFVKLIKTCFKMNYEITLKGASIIIPFSIYEFIGSIARNDISTNYIGFVMGAVMIALAPCYYCNRLMDKGEEVSFALYCSGWEKFYAKETHSSVFVMLTHASRPIAIRTVFKTLSLEALTDVFRQAYTIFNLLNIIWG